MGNTTAIRARVTGRVQGVGFRATAQEVGTRLGIDGWVRNAADGTVEAWAQGASDAVERFRRFLHDGPRAGLVSSVQVTQVDPDPTLHGFGIRW